MGIFMTALRNNIWKYSQILNFHIALLVFDCLLCSNEAILASYPILGN